MLGPLTRLLISYEMDTNSCAFDASPAVQAQQVKHLALNTVRMGRGETASNVSYQEQIRHRQALAGQRLRGGSRCPHEGWHFCCGTRRGTGGCPAVTAVRRRRSSTLLSGLLLFYRHSTAWKAAQDSEIWDPAPSTASSDSLLKGFEGRADREPHTNTHTRARRTSDS